MANWSATGICSGLRTRWSSSRTDTSHREVGEIGQEACVILETAQVEHERLFFDAPDHRNRQCTQGGRECFQGLSAFRPALESEPGARQSVEGQGAGSDLAATIDHADGEGLTEHI